MDGVGVVVTRDEGPDGPLGRRLADRRLRVHRWPTVRSAPPADPAPLHDALADLEAYDWVVFTSPRAVAAVTERVPAAPDGPRIAAVGRSTASSLEAGGWPVDLVPETWTGEALVTALIEAGVADGARVLFPASAIARDTVPEGLVAAGAEVVQVDAYTTEPAPLDRDACRSALESGDIALITFTSPSSVEGLAAALGDDVMALARARTRAVAIGPTTAEAAGAAGFADVAVADPHSLDGLADRAAEAARASIQEA
jgi:uroporphyrinogen-III synthase